MPCPSIGPISVSRTGSPRFQGRGRAGLTFLGLRVCQGGTPKDPEKTRWVGLDFYRRKDGVPPQGPRGRDPEISGSGQGGFDLFRPRGVIGHGPQGP
jgi:hypothetical protein